MVQYMVHVVSFGDHDSGTVNGHVNRFLFRYAYIVGNGASQPVVIGYESQLLSNDETCDVR